MARLPILIAPHPTLKTKARPVSGVDDELRQLIDDMLETMYAAPGIGLAANQVGVLKRVLVLDVAREGEAPAPMALVNPEILWISEEESTANEGCLSIPEQYADVTRPAEVKFAYLDRNGKRRQQQANGLLATCVQHEIDHLNGILFVDHLSALKRNIIMRKLVKAQKAKAEAAM
jgi:peptide deformylase